MKRHINTVYAKELDKDAILSIDTQYEPIHLEQQTPHALDSTITFTEDDHKYSILDTDGTWISDGITSVSTLIHEFFPHFDPDHIISKMRNSPRFKYGKYVGMSDDDIKTLWKNNGESASSRGTKLHFLLECHNNGYDLNNSPFTGIPEVQDYFRWYAINMMNEVPFRTELRMHTGRTLRLAGTADLITIDKNHPAPSDCNSVLSVHLKDWKFSKAIKKSNSYEKGYGVCKHLDNCNYIHYALQQNMYQWMLETYYTSWNYNGHVYDTIRVVSKHLVIFHENHPRDGYYLELPDMHDVVSNMIGVREAYIQTRFPEVTTKNE
jgi:hypothetical protein